MTPWCVSTPSQTRRRLQKQPMSHNDLWVGFHPISNAKRTHRPHFCDKRKWVGSILTYNMTLHASRPKRARRQGWKEGDSKGLRRDTSQAFGMFFFSSKLFIKFTNMFFFSYILHDGACEQVQTMCVWAELYSRTRQPQTKHAQIKSKRRFANVHRCLDLRLHQYIYISTMYVL